MANQSGKNVAPYGWYIASYVVRFIELADESNEDPEARFLIWENTVVVQAEDLDGAYDKVVEIGRSHEVPYKGGACAATAVDVQWKFEGVTTLLPIYEEIEDGAEIMYSERSGVKLKNIRAGVRHKGSFSQ